MLEHTVEVSDLRKRYGDVVALDGVGFAVPPGELFGFVGSNGAGKTTTLRVILGVVRADAGEVLLDGRPITRDQRAAIGYMPEERGLYPRMKVLDHLVYLARLHGLGPDDAHAAAETWIGRLGLGTLRDEEIQRLSLGNRQRVQLAAALVHRPRVLVLDEPFSGLDPLAVDVLADVLRDQASRGVPVVFSSHQLDLVERLCDRVGIIRAGRMVAVGTVAELTGTAPLLRVHAPGAQQGWANSLPGVRVVAEEQGRTVLELDPDTDDQAVLRCALATGPVTEFAQHRRTLTDAFRDVVADPGESR